ncbi:YhgE/Pip family protein [Bacillus songklensis]|uniref:YhgE/Pip family protein n=1 Tax=Bacillus songklensis TaxID=1069116 RepID=A0ABV8B160_9BACI
MKGLSTLIEEFSAVVKNRKILISVIGVLFVPLLYSSVLLWAFWDPYGHVDKLPVAVVNEDRGATMDGEKLNIGDELIDNLKEEKKFDWKFVSKEGAQKGLTSQKYYMIIEIPKDFSQNATTLKEEHPKKLDLIYTANEGSNFLSTKIGDSAIARIKEEVSNNITETYAETVFADIKDVSKGLADASEGAGKLHDGIDSAKNGANDLQGGIDKVKNGINEVHGGIDKAKNGVNELHNGIDSAQNGANEIHGGIDNAKSGVNELHNGINSAENGANNLYNGIDSAKSGADKLNKGINETSEGAGKLHIGIEDAKGGAETISSGLDQSLAGMNELNGKLPQLTSGSEKVSEGAGQLASSLTQWTEGAQSVKDGAAQVSAGLDEMIQKIGGMIAQTSDPQQKAVLQSMKDNLTKLAAGNEQVEGGLNELSASASKMKDEAEGLSAGANQLHQGQLALGDGMKRLIQGQEQLANGSKQLSSGLGELAVGSAKLQDGTNRLASGSGELVNGMSKLADGSGELANGMNKLSDGSGELANGMNKLSDGSGELANGMNKLSSGSGELANGMNKLSSGSGELANGMNKLSDGSGELANGMNELSEGSNELASKLSNGAKEMSDVKANDEVYNMFADPVDVKNTKINKVPNYGTGVAPYFVSLSLFVGALVISIVFPFYEPANVPKNGFSWFIGKFGILAVVGVIQALLVDAILLVGLGMEVQSVPLFLLFSVFTSLTFMALIQMLVTPLGNPGRFIAIIILILQLSTSAGTFPLELIPAALQPFHSWLPMSYSVAGFKAVISSGDFAFMWNNATVLSMFLVIAAAGTITYLTIQHKRKFSAMVEEKGNTINS